MRTTVSLDDDLFQVLERKAEASRLPFKKILNQTLRRGLAAEQLAVNAPALRVVTRPFEGGLKPGIDPDRMNQLNDELEVEAFLQKAQRDGYRP